MNGFVKLSRLIVFCLLCMGLGLNPATAQSLSQINTNETPAVEVGPPSPNDVKELIRLLEDQRIRNWLEKGAENLDESEADDGQSIGDGLKSQLSAGLDRTRDRARLLQGAWQHLSDAPGLLAREWREAITPGGTVRSLTYVLIFMFIGGGLEWLYRQYTNRRLLRLQLITRFLCPAGYGLPCRGRC